MHNHETFICDINLISNYRFAKETCFEIRLGQNLKTELDYTYIHIISIMQHNLCSILRLENKVCAQTIAIIALLLHQDVAERIVYMKVLLFNHINNIIWFIYEVQQDVYHFIELMTRPIPPFRSILQQFFPSMILLLVLLLARTILQLLVDCRKSLESHGFLLDILKLYLKTETLRSQLSNER